MNAVLAASILCFLVVVSWHFGRAIEWFVSSPYCWPFVRRLFFTVLPLVMLSLLVLRALL